MAKTQESVAAEIDDLADTALNLHQSCGGKTVKVSDGNRSVKITAGIDDNDKAMLIKGLEKALVIAGQFFPKSDGKN